jgi:hypothetical protein
MKSQSNNFWLLPLPFSEEDLHKWKNIVNAVYQLFPEKNYARDAKEIK